MLKAADWDTLYGKLADLGLCDADGNEAAGVSIVKVDPLWLVKPEVDIEGNVVVVGVKSTECHVNVRDNRRGGISNPAPYHEEDNPTGINWGDVTWVDPANVSTPQMVWA